MIRHDYPHIQKWLLHIYYDLSPTETRGAFRSTTDFVAVGLTLRKDISSYAHLTNNVRRSSRATPARRSWMLCLSGRRRI